MTNYGKPRPEPTQNPTLKSKEERKELLEEVERRRRIIYSRFYQKQRLEVTTQVPQAMGKGWPWKTAAREDSMV